VDPGVFVHNIRAQRSDYIKHSEISRPGSYPLREKKGVKDSKKIKKIPKAFEIIITNSMSGSYIKK
jgi:hypothetical protein